jgi:hypothetical protein
MRPGSDGTPSGRGHRTTDMKNTNQVSGMYPIIRRARRPLMPPEPPVKSEHVASDSKSPKTETELGAGKNEESKANADKEDK